MRFDKSGRAILPDGVIVNHGVLGKRVIYSNYDAVTFKVPVVWAVDIFAPVQPEKKPISCEYFFFDATDKLSWRLEEPNGNLLVNINGGYSDIQCNIGVLRHDFKQKSFYKSLIAVAGRFGIRTDKLYQFVLESAPLVGSGSFGNPTGYHH